MLKVPDDFHIEFFEKSSDPPLQPNNEEHFPKFDFARVKHVENVEKGVDLRTLLYALTCNLTDLLEKIAALFYWLATVEESQIKFPESSPNSLEFLFNNLLKNVTWQPDAFEFLCRCLGVPCSTIVGIARTLDYSPISDGDNTNHMWNGIFFSGKWYLCDIIWSSKVIIKDFIEEIISTNSKTTRTKLFTNQYFLTAPIKMRTTHFPTIAQWQLLPNLITFETLDSYPILTAHYFDSPLRDLNYEAFSMVSETGYFKLVLPFCGESSVFHLLQYFDNDTKLLISKTKTNIHIKSYSLIEKMMENITLYFRFPWQGYYYITICSQNDTEEQHLVTQYKALLKWRILCKTTDINIERYFGCHDMSLGPSWSHFQYYGLSPVNLTSGIIKIDYSPPAYIEACFAKSNRDVIVLAKIRGSVSLLPSNYTPDSSNDPLGSLCHGQCLDWLIDEEDDTESEISFTIRLPKYGEYSLEIYANFPKEGDTFVQIAQYLLEMKATQSDRIAAMKSEN